MENKPVKLTTIEELDTFFKEKGISSEKTRFFINENRNDPKCFGIYKEGDEYIVYKNKANGQRFTRYKGNNESIAVNIFFSKLVDEMDLRTGLKKEKEKTKRHRCLYHFLCGYRTLFNPTLHRTKKRLLHHQSTTILLL